MHMIDDSVALDLHMGSQLNTSIACSQGQILEHAVARVRAVISANETSDEDRD